MAGFDNIIAGLTGHNAGGGLQGNPLMDIGLGLLSVAGPSTQPRSIGDGLLAGIKLSNERQAAQLNNALAREKLKQVQDARNAEAQQKAVVDRVFGNGETSSGLLGNLGLSPAQQGLLGAYAQADPQGALGLLGNVAFPKDYRPTSDIQNAQFAYPDDPAKQRQYIIDHANAQGADASTLQALDAKIKLLDIQQKLADLNKTQHDQTQLNAETEASIIQDLNHGKEMYSLLNDLEGTAAETGLPLPELRKIGLNGVAALGSALGIDTGKAKDLAAKLDRFDKLATNYGVQAMTQLLSGQRLGQTEFQQLINNGTSAYSTTQANRLALADIMETELNQAKAMGIDVQGASDYRKLIDQLRTGPDKPAGPPVIDVPKLLNEGSNAVNDLTGGGSGGSNSGGSSGVVDFNDYKE